MRALIETEWQSFAARFGKIKVIWATQIFSATKNEKRREQWVNSRLCEAQLKEALLEDSLVIFTSISHTEDVILAVGLSATGKSERAIGVGVDLERRTRAMSQAVYHRVVSQEEQIFEKAHLGALDFWVIKEACFKANPLNQGTVIPQYRVTEWDFATKRGKTVIGPIENRIEKKIEIHFQLLTAQEWTAALAISVEL